MRFIDRIRDALSPHKERKRNPGPERPVEDEEEEEIEELIALDII